MHAQQHAPLADAAFEPLGFVFRNPETGQGADDPAQRPDRARAGQQRDDRTGGDKSPQSGDSKGANARQPPQDATGNAARQYARGDPFWRLGVLLVRQVLRPHVLREEHRNVGAAETRGS